MDRCTHAYLQNRVPATDQAVDFAAFSNFVAAAVAPLTFWNNVASWADFARASSTAAKASFADKYATSASGLVALNAATAAA